MRRGEVGELRGEDFFPLRLGERGDGERLRDSRRLACGDGERFSDERRGVLSRCRRRRRRLGVLRASRRRLCDSDTSPLTAFITALRLLLTDVSESSSRCQGAS